MLYKLILREKVRPERLNRGVFLPQMTAYFLLQGQRGGCNKKKHWCVTHHLSFISLILSGLSPYSSPHPGRSAEIRGDDSDPP